MENLDSFLPFLVLIKLYWGKIYLFNYINISHLLSIVKHWIDKRRLTNTDMEFLN